MLRREELTEEEVEKFVHYSKELFNYMNPNFLEGFISIFEHAIIKTKDNEFNLKNNLENYPDQEYQIGRTPELIEEFYNSLSASLGEMAHNELRRMKFFMSPHISSKEDVENEKNVPYSKKRIASFLESNRERFTLEGNYRDVVVGSHEVAHRFNPISSQTNISSLLFTETDTIFVETLCTDFINDKYKNNFVGIFPVRCFSFVNRQGNTSDNLNDIEKLGCLAKYLSFIQKEITSENIDEFRDKIIELDEVLNMGRGDIIQERVKEIALTQTTENFMYDFATVLGSYLYQQAQEYPEKKNEIFEKLLAIKSYTVGFEEEQISAIEELGLPIIKDRKLSIDEQGIKALIDSFDKTYETFNLRQNNKENSSKKIENQSVRDKIKDAINTASIEKKVEAKRKCEDILRQDNEKGKREQGE